MQIFMINLLMKIVMGSIPADKLKEAVAKWREEIEKKILESEGQLDDALWASFEASEGDIKLMADFALDLLENMIKESGTKLDDAIGNPVILRFREVFEIPDND